MATPITVAEMVADIDEMIAKVCHEEGLDKDEFMFRLLNAMLYRPTPVIPYKETV